MKPGDLIVWLPDPLHHGIGRIDEVAKDGWLWVTFEDDHRGCYDPHGLELASVWWSGRVSSLSDDELALFANPPEKQA